MKTGKSTGKEDELRMPAADFDRIMGQALGAAPPEGQKKDGGLRPFHDKEREPPPYLGENPPHTDVPKYDPDKRPPKQPPKK